MNTDDIISSAVSSVLIIQPNDVAWVANLSGGIIAEVFNAECVSSKIKNVLKNNQRASSFRLLTAVEQEHPPTVMTGFKT